MSPAGAGHHHARDEDTFRVHLGHVEQNVSVHLRRFPSGGSWSWFGCPTCGKWARTLRLHLDEIVCPDCCKRRGVRQRADTMSVRKRAGRMRIPKLRAMLESKESLRLKPVLRGTMERRSRLEARLRECEFRAVHGRRASGKNLVVDDPCNESGFPCRRSPPRPPLSLKSAGADRTLMPFIPKRPASLAHLTDQGSRSGSEQTFRRHR